MWTNSPTPPMFRIFSRDGVSREPTHAPRVGWVRPFAWRKKMAMQRDELDKREIGNLIGSDMVEGTAVYGVDDSKIGSIERVMIDKISGRVSYAVLGFGGFLGLGNDHYPLPWQSLKYDTRLGGYRTGVTENQLRGAPSYRNESEWNWSDPARNRALDDYYGVPLV
jgi:hypothetical protein